MRSYNWKLCANQDNSHRTTQYFSTCPPLPSSAPSFFWPGLNNGNKKLLGQFTNAAKNGNWTWWDEKGNITTSKNYTNGLLIVNNDNFDTYLEKFEFFLAKRDYKEALKTSHQQKQCFAGLRTFSRKK